MQMVTQRLPRDCWLSVAIVLMGLLLGSCAQSGSNPAEAEDQPTVVSTSTILTNWVEQVGGDEIELIGILEPGADPHIYEPVPLDSRSFEEADLILYNGYNLEPGLIKLMGAAGVNARKVAVGEVVPPLRMDYNGRSVPDPHVWGDVSNAILIIEAIRDALTELSPSDREEFAQNAEEFITELQRLDAWVKQQIDTIPEDQRQLITTHDAFQYYAQAYGLEVTGTLIGISTEEQPSAQTVQKLVESVKTTGVPAIFAETTINPRLIATVAEEAGVQLASQELYSDSIGAPGSQGDSYIKMIISNTQTIVENLGGQYQPF